MQQNMGQHWPTEGSDFGLLGENLIAKEFGDLKVWCGRKWNVEICGEISVW